MFKPNSDRILTLIEDTYFTDGHSVIHKECLAEQPKDFTIRNDIKLADGIDCDKVVAASSSNISFNLNYNAGEVFIADDGSFMAAIDCKKLKSMEATLKKDRRKYTIGLMKISSKSGKLVFIEDKTKLFLGAIASIHLGEANVDGDTYTLLQNVKAIQNLIY